MMRLLFLSWVQLVQQNPWYRQPEWVAVGLTAIYVVLTLAYVIFAALTLDAIKKQAKSGQTQFEKQLKVAGDAASAAQKSAEALISTERAWIMVELELVPGYPLITHGASIDRKSYTSASIRFIYTNEGKTIAWIDQKLACFQIVKELPKRPDFGVLEMLDCEPEWVGVKGGGQLDKTLEAEGQEGMVEISVIWGVIRYRDAFDVKHETVFGFRILPDYRFERIAGLTEYNKTT